MPIVPPSYGQTSGGPGGGGLSRDQVLSLIRGNATEFTFGNAFPGSPPTGALHYITVDNVTIAAKNSDGDAITEGFNGNLFRFDGGDWRFIYNFRSLIEVLIAVYSLYVGEYAARTAYAKNKIVTSGSDIFWTVAAVADTNTTAPASNSSFVQLNGGGTSSPSSGITAQQFLAAMPDYLKVKSASLDPPYFDPNAVHSSYIAEIEVINGSFPDTEELVIYFNGIPVETSTNFDSSAPNTINVDLTASQRSTLGLALAVAGQHTITVGFEFVDASNQTIYLHNIEVQRVSYPLPLGINSLSFSPPFLNPNDLKSRLTAHVGVLPDAFLEATQIRLDLNGVFGDAVALDRTTINKPFTDLNETQLATIKGLLDSITELTATVHFLDSSDDNVFSYPIAIPKADIANVSGGLTTDQTKILARVAGFDIRDFRGGRPSPLITDPDELALAKKTIGIGTGGKIYTLEHTEQSNPVTTWIDFDNANWDFEQTEDLPLSALQTGDFFYLPNGGTSPNRGVWRVYDGTKLNSYDDVDTFLTDTTFLGNFPNQASAALAIGTYDSNTTYLAYFPTTVAGRSGREVQQLSSYAAGTISANRWVPSDEELHSLIGNVELEIRDAIAEITGDEGIIRANTNARSGVRLITSSSERLITNFNGAGYGRTQADAVDTPSFMDISARQNTEAGYESVYLSRFDRLRLIVSLLGASNVVLTSTEVEFGYAKWASLKGLPRPAQNSYQDATIQDNRALVFNWMPDGIPDGLTSGGQTRGRVNEWLDSFRNADRTIYVGKTSDSNPRMMIAVKGFRGDTIGVDLIGYLSSSA